MTVFENIPLPYKILDSNSIKAKKFKFNKKYPNLAVYEALNQVNVAYCNTDRNKWYSLYQNDIEFTMGYKIENLDDKNLPEVILYWQEFKYDSLGGTSTDWMSVIRLDSLPVRIFKICLGCNEEFFGDKKKGGLGSYYLSYLRNVKVTHNSIVVERNDKKKYPFPECPVSTIPKGTYKMVLGQIVKMK